MKNRMIGVALVMALAFVASCSSGGRLFFNDPPGGAPVYYSAPATYAAPCGG